MLHWTSRLHSPCNGHYLVFPRDRSSCRADFFTLPISNEKNWGNTDSNAVFCWQKNVVYLSAHKKPCTTFSLIGSLSLCGCGWEEKLVIIVSDNVKEKRLLIIIFAVQVNPFILINRIAEQIELRSKQEEELTT